MGGISTITSGLRMDAQKYTVANVQHELNLVTGESIEAYWLDGVWKQGAGRPKAPMCKPNTNQALNWLYPHKAIRDTFSTRGSS